MFQAFSLPAVVVNGKVLSRGGELPNPDALCHHIRCLLGNGGGDHRDREDLPVRSSDPARM
jgi:hypothetical protein